MWFEARTAGPLAGMCSAPVTVTSHRMTLRVPSAAPTTVRYRASTATEPIATP